MGGVAVPLVLWAGERAGGRSGAHFLPFMLAGGLLLAAGLAAPALPETLGATPPQTIQARPHGDAGS